MRERPHRAVRPGWGPRRPMGARPRASPPLRFDLVIFHIFQKQQKHCSESKSRTFYYQYCYLFKVELCRTVNLTFDENFRSHQSNNVAPYLLIKARYVCIVLFPGSLIAHTLQNIVIIAIVSNYYIVDPEGTIKPYNLHSHMD